MASQNYLFQSKRLGFRTWNLGDIDKLSQINADPSVMEYFPNVLDRDQTLSFIERMNAQFVKNGFCYFAVDHLERNELIGFIGLSEQTYVATFTPCVDIGWRIAASMWGQGLASEGAKRCLEYAQNQLKLSSIYAVSPKINIRSENVMIKIGMTKQYEFEHPLLENVTSLRTCVLYKIDLTVII